MRFTIYGVEHDTERMLAFQTGSMEEPTVYMDQNCLVFVERRMDGAGNMIRLASTKTIAMLADRYGIQPLGLGDPLGSERTLSRFRLRTISPLRITLRQARRARRT